MKIVLVTIAAAFVIGIIVFGSGNYGTPKISTASEFVDSMQLGKNFYDISYRAAQITTTYRGIVKKTGQPEAKKLLEKHLRQSIDKRQPEWNRNLTKSYLQYFNERELISIANERANSEFAKKFEEQRGEVGKHMQSISTQLVKDALGEALKNAYEEIH